MPPVKTQSVDKFEIEVGCRPPGGNVGDSRPECGNGKTSLFGVECGVPHATARRAVAYLFGKNDRTCRRTGVTAFGVRNLARPRLAQALNRTACTPSLSLLHREKSNKDDFLYLSIFLKFGNLGDFCVFPKPAI